MEIPIYYTFIDFEREYLFDYNKYYASISLADYYEILLKEYTDRSLLLNDYFEINNYNIKYNNLIVDDYIKRKKERHLQIYFDRIQKEFDWHSICNDILLNEYFEFISLNLKKKVSDIKLTNKLGGFKSNIEIFNEFVLKRFENIHMKLINNFHEITLYIERKRIESKINTQLKKINNKLSNPKKLALLKAIGFFDLPTIIKLSEDSQNEIVALLLDADKKEFVYKNRLNLNSKNPNYQIDKYTAFQYVEEMERLLNEMR